MADFGDVELGFDTWFGNRLDAGVGGRSGSLWLRVAGGRARWSCRRLWSNAANGFGDFLFEWAARAGLQGHGCEAGKNFESSRERRGSGLGAKHGGKRIGRLAAGAGRDDVVDGLLKLVTGALNALEVVAESASDGLFNSVGFRCHSRYRGRFARYSPVLPLWGVGGGASTARGRGCD
jgi:hypothetical protein